MFTAAKTERGNTLPGYACWPSGFLITQFPSGKPGFFSQNLIHIRVLSREHNGHGWFFVCSCYSRFMLLSFLEFTPFLSPSDNSLGLNNLICFTHPSLASTDHFQAIFKTAVAAVTATVSCQVVVCTWQWNDKNALFWRSFWCVCVIRLRQLLFLSYTRDLSCSFILWRAAATLILSHTHLEYAFIVWRLL